MITVGDGKTIPEGNVEAKYSGKKYVSKINYYVDELFLGFLNVLIESNIKA